MEIKNFKESNTAEYTIEFTFGEYYENAQIKTGWISPKVYREWEHIKSLFNELFGECPDNETLIDIFFELGESVMGIDSGYSYIRKKLYSKIQNKILNSFYPLLEKEVKRNFKNL